MPLSRKPSAAQTSERRREVYRLLMQGLGHSEISRRLDVSRQTIVSDAKRINSAIRERACDADTFSEVGVAAAKLELIANDAMTAADHATSLRDKNYLLATAANAIERRARLLMDSGLIERAPVDVGFSISDFRKMTTTEMLQVRANLIERIKQHGIDLESPPGISARPHALETIKSTPADSARAGK